MIILRSLKKSWELNSHLSLDYLILYNSYKSAWSNLNTCFSYTPQAKSAKLGWGGKKKREDVCKNIKDCKQTGKYLENRCPASVEG